VQRSGDDIRLHISELNADAREEVIRAFFSSASIPTIPHGALPIYSLGAWENSHVTAWILKFNAWGPFLVDGVMPALFRAPRRQTRNRTRQRGERGPRPLEIMTTMELNLASG
jgi:hypothetical protein